MNAFRLAEAVLRLAQRAWHNAMITDDPNQPVLHRQLHVRQKVAHESFKAAMEEMTELASRLRAHDRTAPVPTEQGRRLR